MSTESDRLVKEFRAQDGGATMVCFLGGVHIEVARFNNASDDWDLLPAGRDILTPPPPVEDNPLEQPHIRQGKKTKNLSGLVEGL